MKKICCKLFQIPITDVNNDSLIIPIQYIEILITITDKTLQQINAILRKYISNSPN